MPLLEEVTEGADESAGDAESLKAAHRRKRSKGSNKKKKKTEVRFALVFENTSAGTCREIDPNSYLVPGITWFVAPGTWYLV